MTLPEALRLLGYWRGQPPTHVIAAQIAVALGMKPPSKDQPKQLAYSTRADVEGLGAAFPRSAPPVL